MFQESIRQEESFCISFGTSIIAISSLFSRASGQYFSLQIILLPSTGAIVSYGVRSVGRYQGSTQISLIATRDKIRFHNGKEGRSKNSFSNE